MRNVMVRLTCCALGALAVADFAASCQAAATAAVRVTTDQIGNVFAPGDPIRFTADGPAGPWSWLVRDWQGARIAGGDLTAAAGPTTFEVPESPSGYYELEVTPASCAPACAGTAAYAVLPRPDGLSSVFGVMTHVGHGWDTGFVPLLARAGIGNVRDEQYWHALERSPGKFAFPPAWVDYMAQLAAAGVQPLLAMTFANPLYDDGKTPTSGAARKAYGRFGVALAQRYPDQVRALEVWNEINGNWCDGACPQDRAGTYAGLLDAAWDALKAAAPDVRVVGGSTAGAPLPFWRKLADRGVFDRLDVVSVHIYRDAPEGGEREIEDLRALMHEHGVDRPIWVTETGSGGPSPEQRRAAAIWLVKEMTLLRSADVARVYWYLMRDYQSFDGLGLVRAPDSPYGRYAPNPAYVAYATLIRVLGAARSVRREALPDPRTRVYLFDQSGTEVRVVWSAEGATTLDAAVSGTLTEVDVMGRARTLMPRHGEATLALDARPVFLVGAIRGLRERRADRVLADSRADFSMAAERDGWRYGYAVLAPGEDYDGRQEFHPLQPRQNEWASFWGDPHWPYLMIADGVMHPATIDGQQVAVVRRWLAPEAASITISGRLEIGASPGDGTRAVILVDGRKIGAWSLAPGTAEPYSLTAAVRPGSTVDLVVTPGPGLNDGWDSTTFTAKILLKAE
jgi:Glycosyl hydrolase catalytic core